MRDPSNIWASEPELLLTAAILHRSCLLHRFVKNEWRVLSSQTIGVEFASKIITNTAKKTTELTVQVLPNNKAMVTTALVSISMKPAPRKKSCT